MPGDFSNTSKAEAPTLVTAASTFTIVLSIFCSINGFLATTVTPSIDFAKGTSSIDLVLVFDNYNSKISTLHYQEHCFVLTALFIDDRLFKDIHVTQMCISGYRFQSLVDKRKIFTCKRS